MWCATCQLYVRTRISPTSTRQQDRFHTALFLIIQVSWCFYQRCGTVTFFRFRFRKLWFRFQLLKSYGSGSYFWKVTVPALVPAPYLDHKKQIKKKMAFYFVSCFTRKKLINFTKFIVYIMWMKNILNEWNQIYNFISSSGSGIVIIKRN